MRYGVPLDACPGPEIARVLEEARTERGGAIPIALPRHGSEQTSVDAS